MESAQSVSAILLKIGSLYHEASDPILIDTVTEGNLSKNFILQSGQQKFFLKQYRFHDLKVIQQIQLVKSFFAQGGIPVILPFSHKRGDSVFEHEGKFYSIFPFREGRILQRCHMPPEALRSAGRMLARIHLLSKGGSPEFLKKRITPWDKQKTLPVIQRLYEKVDHKTAKDDFDDLTLTLLRLKIKLIRENNLSSMQLGLAADHLLHGDYHDKNLFFDEHNEVRYVFDLEKAVIAPRTLEIARSMDFICFDGLYEEGNFRDACVYLAGYHELYPISHDELRRGIQLYYFKKVYSLWLEQEHHERGNHRIDCFLTRELSMLQYYSQHLNEYIGKLTF